MRWIYLLLVPMITVAVGAAVRGRWATAILAALMTVTAALIFRKALRLIAQRRADVAFWRIVEADAKQQGERREQH